MVRAVRPAALRRTVDRLVGFGTRNTLSVQDDPRRGIGAARDWLADEFRRIGAASGGRLEVSLQSFVQQPAPRVPHPTSITNVVALLPGESAAPTDRVYVVAAHYDSMCGDVLDAVSDAPGANDDGSGVAAVLEAARVMSPYRFEAQIAFVLVAGEEQGLLGSRHFAAEAVRAGWRIEAMLANDMVGNTVGPGGARADRAVRVFSEGVPACETPEDATGRRAGGGENDSASRQVARFVQEQCRRYVRGLDVALVFRRDRCGRGGDHLPFQDAGYPAVRVTETLEEFRRQHQYVRTEDGFTYGDLPEYVNGRYLARVTRLNVATLATLARAPAAPRDARVVVGAPSHDTELAWEADAEAAGYEVVWRSTTASVWTHGHPVGSVTRALIEGVNRDDWFFGVRAVGRAGHASPVSFARMRRA